MNHEYKEWNRVVGRGIRTWLPGDAEKPTGPIKRKVMYFKTDSEAVRSAIDEVNRKVPRIGGRIDPWWRAELEFLKLGNTAVEMVVGDTALRASFGLVGDKYYFTDFTTGETTINRAC